MNTVTSMHKVNNTGFFRITWKVSMFMLKFLFNILKMAFHVSLFILRFCVELISHDVPDTGMSFSDELEVSRMKKQIKKLNKKVAKLGAFK